MWNVPKLSQREVYPDQMVNSVHPPWVNHKQIIVVLCQGWGPKKPRIFGNYFGEQHTAAVCRTERTRGFQPQVALPCARVELTLEKCSGSCIDVVFSLLPFVLVEQVILVPHHLSAPLARPELPVAPLSRSVRKITLQDFVAGPKKFPLANKDVAVDMRITKENLPYCS